MRTGGLPAKIFANSLNVAGIALVLLYVVVEARGGISLEGHSISRQVRDVLWFSLLCGVAAFATIEILKRVFGLRGLYQYRQTRVWLEERTGGGRAFDELLEAMGLDPHQGKWYRGEQRRVFNLPTEQLSAQVSAAADVALASLTSLTTEDDVDHYVALIAGVTGLPSAAILHQVRTSHRPSETESYGGAQQAELSARVRLGVDQLQISLSERWRRYVQGAALWISGDYGIALVHDSPVRRGTEARYVLAALVLGGLFAWIARDIAAVIERSRR